jgi:glycine cleavage system transcriptional repressor
MTTFSLSAIGSDRPGIVSALSGALADLGCNLEDSTMTILRGQFAVLLVVAAPDGSHIEPIATRLAQVAADLDLILSVNEITEPQGPSDGAPAGADEPEPWTVSLYGADRIGIVHQVSAALAEGRGNIVDLSTHLTAGPDGPAYVVVLRATFPPGDAALAVAESVRSAAQSVGVHCTVRPDDADLL